MPLLSRPEEAQPEEPVDEPNANQTEPTEQSGEFDSAAVEDSILGELQGKAKADVERVVAAGTKLIFSKEGGFELFDEIREDIPLADELGSAAVNISLILIEKSGNTLPGEAVGPAGVILLARACEFINKNNIAEVTYDIFAEAVKMFVHVIAQKLGALEDGENVEEGSGQEGIGSEQSPQIQQSQPANGSLLNQGVA